MSDIDNFIKKECPYGVKYFTLKEISNIKRGERITKKDISEDGLYPVMSGGVNPMGRFSDKNREANTITISSYGAAGFINYVTEDFWANDVCLSVFPNEDIIDKRYLYFALKAQQQYIYDNTTKAIPDHIPTKFLEDLKIPVPPLNVQQKIAGMLNNFTELEAELEAELTKRKQQYEYYRNQLLNFERERERSRVEWRTIGDLCEICRGVVMSKDYIRENPGEYPVYSSQTENNGVLGLINSYNYEGNYLSWTTDGAKAGTVFRRREKFSVTNVCGLLKIKDANYVDFDYLFYILSSTTPKYVAKGMGNAKLMSNVMASIKIPIPPKAEQVKIASILNSFNAITEDMSEGLPAEIEARSKQYVYYRDKLLTFKERVV